MKVAVRQFWVCIIVIICILTLFENCRKANDKFDTMRSDPMVKQYTKEVANAVVARIMKRDYNYEKAVTFRNIIVERYKINYHQDSAAIRRLVFEPLVEEILTDAPDPCLEKWSKKESRCCRTVIWQSGLAGLASGGSPAKFGLALAGILLAYDNCSDAAREWLEECQSNQ